MSRAIGMSLADFYDHSPWEFFCAIAGWQKANGATEQVELPSEEWMQMMSDSIAKAGH